jgi:hypothetical protein
VPERDADHRQSCEVVYFVEVDLLNALVERLDQPEWHEDEEPRDEQQPPLLAAGACDAAKDGAEVELGIGSGYRPAP